MILRRNSSTTTTGGTVTITPAAIGVPNGWSKPYAPVNREIAADRRRTTGTRHRLHPPQITQLRRSHVCARNMPAGTLHAH